MAIKRILRLTFVLLLFFSLAGGFSSCKSVIQSCNDPVLTEEEAEKKKEALRISRKSDIKLIKKYNKSYKRQTKIQNEQQRDMIKQGRKRPKNMGKPKSRFFLFRCLGI